VLQIGIVIGDIHRHPHFPQCQLCHVVSSVRSRMTIEVQPYLKSMIGTVLHSPGAVTLVTALMSRPSSKVLRQPPHADTRAASSLVAVSQNFVPQCCPRCSFGIRY